MNTMVCGLTYLGNSSFDKCNYFCLAAISLTQQVHTAQYVDSMSKNVSLALATQEAIDRKL